MKNHDGLKAGDPIPGSRYFREFCVRCGAALRVTDNKIGTQCWCNDCDPKHIGVGNHRGQLDDHDAFAKNRGD